MKKLLILFCFLVVSMTFIASLAPTASAVSSNPLESTCDNPAAKESSICKTPPTGDENPVSGSAGIMQNVIRLVQILAGVAGVIMIIIGGYQYVTSSGDSAKINSAKNTILFAVIGLVITVIAQVIIIFIVRSL